MTASIKANPHVFLREIKKQDTNGWVTKNTAILIVHGIGNQLPLETLDQFGRGLLNQFGKELRDHLKISHEIVAKPAEGAGGVWFDNVLRISKTGDEHYIDLYEYYWANYAQDKATGKDIRLWLNGVISGAKIFYNDNANLGETYMNNSIFFDKKTGKFKGGRYRLFISVLSKVLFFLDFLSQAINFLVSLIPYIGKFADSYLQKYADGKILDITNVIGEVVVYNVSDPKSKFYDVRRKILDEAVVAIRYLIEKVTINDPAAGDNSMNLYYPSVVIAGHSLGSQISYDAINKINLLINEGEISTYDKNGICKTNDKLTIAGQLNGFITFGCPLDKIVFFLRENIPAKDYLRVQFLDHYHGFKQRSTNLIPNGGRTRTKTLQSSCALKPHLKDVKWRNYYDDQDYVSGGLDFYEGLTNINCQFKKIPFGFTHSNYWDSSDFFKDIIHEYLSN